jgi:hypothetical protein
MTAHLAPLGAEVEGMACRTIKKINISIQSLVFCLKMTHDIPDDRGLLLRNLPDISPPSVCGILRRGPSCSLQHCIREEGGKEELDSNLADTLVLEVSLQTPRLWVAAVPATCVAGALCLT